MSEHKINDDKIQQDIKNEFVAPNVLAQDPSKKINVKKIVVAAGVTVVVLGIVGTTLLYVFKSKPENEVPTTKPPITTPDDKVDPLTAFDLLNDPFLKGYIGEGANNCFFPNDPVWDRLMASKVPLKVGESYTETFDRDYFDTRFRAQTMGHGVDAYLSNKANEIAGSGNSLVIDSLIGKYTGTYLKGMKFEANGVYQIEFDYNIIKESDDFFFQFRADSDGKNGERTGDKFVTIKGKTGTKGSERFVVNLDNFQDYGLMIFPRNNSGKLAIDNIKITRLKSGYNSLSIGQTIKENFDDTMYFEVDKDPAPNSGYVTGDKAIDGKSLYIESLKEYQGVYLKGLKFAPGGKYQIKFDYRIDDPTSNFYLQLTSKSGKHKQFYSFGDNLVPKGEVRTFDRVFEINGNEAEYLLQLFPGAGNEKSGITIDDIEVTRLDPSWSCFKDKTPTEQKPLFEDFNKGLYFGNFLPTQHGTGLYDIVNNKLQITMPDKFSGVEFTDGLRVINGKKYKVSFDYEVLENPDLSAFYVQFTGGVDFAEIKDLHKGKTGKYEATITAGKEDSERVALQMFGNQSGLKINIDNVKIEVPTETNVPKDVELNVGDKYVNDFDNNDRLIFDLDNVPNSTIGKNENTIDKNSLILNSNGDYKGAYIKGVKLDNKGTYRVRFNYKVLERQDVFYFQFVSKSGLYSNAAQFGNGNVPLNTVRTFDQIFTLNDTEEIIMQMFPGGATGNSSLVVDDFTIERLDGNAPIFEEKEPTEDSPIIEDFENGLYGGATTPNQQGSGIFDIIEDLNSNALKVTMPDAFSGVQFGKGIKYVIGQKYNISFDYKVLENPNNSAFYVQIGGADFKEINGLTTGSNGKVQTTLTAGSVNGNPEVLQIFSNQPGLTIVIDNIRIEKFAVPKTPLDESFDGLPSYDWDKNNGGIVDITFDVNKLPTNGKVNGLYVNCVNNYDGLIMTPKYQKLQAGNKYDISFDIKALNAPSGAGLYVQSGSNFVLVPIPNGMDQRVEVTLTANSEFIQLFSSVAGLEFTIDNWSIKPHTEENKAESFDDFDNLGINISPNGGGIFNQTDNVPNSGSGKGLYFNCVNAFDGIQIKPVDALALGAKYEITMKYKVVANPNSSSLYIQFGSNFVQVYPENNQDSVFTVTLLAETTDNLQMFSSAAGLELVIDDLVIKPVTTGDFNANFDSDADNFIVNANNGAEITNCYSPDLRPNGATNNSLMVTSTSAYGGVILTPKNFVMETNARYRISFKYKILDNPSNGPLYMQLGAGKGDVQLNSTVGHSQLATVELTAGENLIQMFGGGAPGIKFTLDDFVIERIS